MKNWLGPEKSLGRWIGSLYRLDFFNKVKKTRMVIYIIYYMVNILTPRDLFPH